MKRLIFILTLVTSFAASGQGLTDNITIGLNLPPLIGKTIDLKIESHPKPHWTIQLTAGVMINNRLPGSLFKIDDGTDNLVNSGAYTSLGLRFNSRKEINKTTYFIGYKLIGGYFDQRGMLWDYPEDTPIRKIGLFAALGIETGVTIKFTERFYLDLGFQVSPLLYKEDQVSNYYSVLPGIGSILNFQGIVTPKFYIARENKE